MVRPLRRPAAREPSLASRRRGPIVAEPDSSQVPPMLLTATRSLLLLPPEVPPEAARPLALLQAAAGRLGVPAVSTNSPNWRIGLATGRSQLVAAAVVGEAEVARLPRGTAVFLVLDCLAEADRPEESAWRGM